MATCSLLAPSTSDPAQLSRDTGRPVLPAQGDGGAVLGVGVMMTMTRLALGASVAARIADAAAERLSAREGQLEQMEAAMETVQREADQKDAAHCAAVWSSWSRRCLASCSSKCKGQRQR